MVGSGPGRARTDSELLRVAQFGLRWFGFLVMFSYGLGNNKIGQGMAMIGLGWVGAGQEWLGSVLVWKVLVRVGRIQSYRVRSWTVMSWFGVGKFRDIRDSWVLSVFC